jgi:predicted anti-sigma-YlaC factor YlaD
MKDEMDCKTCRAALPDLLLDREIADVRPELAAHMVKCAECRIEFTELKATFAMLDEWAAPEVSPYFDARLHVRLREAVAAEPEGIWERMRSFLTFSTGRALRPVMAGMLGLTLMLSGGTALLVHQHPASVNDPASATVDDLKIMNNNAQAFQQMDQLLDEPAQSKDDGGGPPTT